MSQLKEQIAYLAGLTGHGDLSGTQRDSFREGVANLSVTGPKSEKQNVPPPQQGSITSFSGSGYRCQIRLQGIKITIKNNSHPRTGACTSTLSPH